MNRDEDLKEAINRWGNSARVKTERISSSTIAHIVGKRCGKGIRQFGIGVDWESAFKDADRKAKVR